MLSFNEHLRQLNSYETREKLENATRLLKIAERTYDTILKKNHRLAAKRLNTHDVVHFFTKEVPLILISFIRLSFDSPQYILAIYDVATQTEYHYKRDEYQYILCYAGNAPDPREQDGELKEYEIKREDIISTTESKISIGHLILRTIDINNLTPQKQMELEILHAAARPVNELNQKLIIYPNIYRGVHLPTPPTTESRQKAVELTRKSVKYITDQWPLINPRNIPMELSCINVPPDSWQLQTVDGERMMTVLVFVPSCLLEVEEKIQKLAKYTNDRFEMQNQDMQMQNQDIKELKIQNQDMKELMKKMELKLQENEKDKKELNETHKREIERLNYEVDRKDRLMNDEEYIPPNYGITQYEAKVFSENGKLVLYINGELYVPLFRKCIMTVTNMSIQDVIKVLDNLKSKRLRQHKRKKHGINKRIIKFIYSLDLRGSYSKAREISNAFGITRSRSGYYMIHMNDFNMFMEEYKKNKNDQ